MVSDDTAEKIRVITSQNTPSNHSEELVRGWRAEAACQEHHSEVSQDRERHGESKDTRASRSGDLQVEE